MTKSLSFWFVLLNTLFVILSAAKYPQNQSVDFSLSSESSKWQSPCHTDLFCHTERSEVSINLKRGFAYLRRGFFARFTPLKMTMPLSYWAQRSIHTKNGEWIAEFMDFSLRSKWQNPPSFSNSKVRFLCPSLRASKASVAIHKFKQTLPQKFKQKPKFCHTDLSCHTKHSLCYTDLFSLVVLTYFCRTDNSCHTER